MSGAPARFPEHAVLLPGTGSDEVFVRDVFTGPLAALGITVSAPAPRAGKDVVTGFLEELDKAAEGGPVLAGGISLGAHLAAEWALTRHDRCAGLLLAMPGWLGAPGEMPAAVSARIAADGIEREGLNAALDAATDGVPGWLAAELRRAWPRQGEGLPAALRTAAAHPAPTARDLRELAVPTGIAACSDDPVHPREVAGRMAAAIPRATLHMTSLAALGEDRGALGRAVVRAWSRARTTAR